MIGYLMALVSIAINCIPSGHFSEQEEIRFPCFAKRRGIHAHDITVRATNMIIQANF